MDGTATGCHSCTTANSDSHVTPTASKAADRARENLACFRLQQNRHRDELAERGFKQLVSAICDAALSGAASVVVKGWKDMDWEMSVPAALRCSFSESDGRQIMLTTIPLLAVGDSPDAKDVMALNAIPRKLHDVILGQLKGKLEKEGFKCVHPFLADDLTVSWHTCDSNNP